MNKYNWYQAPKANKTNNLPMIAIGLTILVSLVVAFAKAI